LVLFFGPSGNHHHQTDRFRASTVHHPPQPPIVRGLPATSRLRLESRSPPLYRCLWCDLRF
jgi:hypothetical protein